jgi:hypothetical protein
MFDWLFHRCKHHNRKRVRGYHTACVDCPAQFGRESRDWMQRVHHMRLVVFVRIATKLSTHMADRADNMTVARELETAAKWQKLAGRMNRIAMDIDDLARDTFEQNQDDAKLPMFN